MIEAKKVLKVKIDGRWVDVPAIKGGKGDKGDPGKDYIITEADKQEIATEVEGKYAERLNAIEPDVAQLKADNIKLKREAAIAEYRIDNLEAAASGKLYREQVLSAESYSDTAYAGTLPFATLDKVGGKSIVWNQLYPVWTARDSSGGVMVANNGDGSQTLSGVSTGSVWAALHFAIPTVLKEKYIIADHKYLVSGVSGHGFLNNTGYWIHCNIGGVEFAADKDTVFTAKSAGSNLQLYLRTNTTGLTINTILHLMIYDLTVMFGAGNEPTAEQFAAMSPAEYYPYSEPTLMDFSTESVVSKGRNLVIGILENTNIAAYGQLQELENFDMHYAPVVKGQTYTVWTNGSELVCGFFTDIPRRGLTSFDGSRIVDNNKTITAPITGYIAFRTMGHYAETQVSVGTTELPYLPHRAPITHDTSALARKYFPDGMKSAGTVHDEIDLENKVAIKRVGTVDLGSLTWAYSTTKYYFSAQFKTGLPINQTRNKNAVIARYELSTGANVYNNTADRIWAINDLYLANDERLFIVDHAYTNKESFKAAMNGVLMYYELAEPITTPITEDIDPYIAVEGGGTVEYHNDHGDEYLVPVAHQMMYLVKTES